MSLTLTRRHNVDRFGYLIPHRYGNLPMVGAVATYRPGEGRFGSAVAVEEGTENRIATPTTFAGWAIGGENAVLDNDGSFYPSQVKFARVRTTSWGFQSNSIPAANGQTWSVSYIARRGTGDGEPCAAIMIMNASNKHVSNIDPTFSSRNIGGGWVRYEATFTINYANTGYIRLRFSVTATNGGYHDFALPQLEQKPYATSFIDGTRAAGVLRYPQLLDKKRGTLSVWINPHVLANWNNFFSMSLSTGRFLLYFDANGSSRWEFGPSNIGPATPAGTIRAGQWTMHTLTWDADVGVYRYYVNGEFVGERQYVEPDSLPSALPTVTNYGALLDEFLILPYAASEEEIVSWYEAQGPLPPHPQASLQWDRQAVRPAQMVKL